MKQQQLSMKQQLAPCRGKDANVCQLPVRKDHLQLANIPLRSKMVAEKE